MKRPLLLFTVLLLATASFAQLPDGSIAPDFTATDINGIEHNLYDILDEGKAVILQFSATWCGPCWSYHTGGALEELNADYGPSGTDELRIFFIESDDSTTDEDLNGTGSATQGDWVTGTTYPIIDDAASIFNAYSNGYYPTIYTVCPNRILTESGQASSVDHASIFQANDCAAASLPNDPALLGYTGGTTACPGEPVNMSVDLMNLGVTNLQYCTIAVMDGSTEVLSYDWSGDLSTYGIANVDLGTAVFDASTSFTIEITSSDDNDVNNSSSGAVELAEESAMLVKVEIQTDNWPNEISWNISDDEGNVIESVAAGELTVPEEVVVWWVSIPEEGCYSFTLTDIYGDGMLAEQWGDYINGSCEVTSWHDENNLASVIYNYDGSYQYETEQAGLAATNLPFTVSGCTDALACNFNSVATIDDGSCLYETCGCMDETACNYDANAEFDDGSCCVCVEGGITMDVNGLDYLIGTWQLSSAEGALSIGPEPLSGAWFSSPENGLEPTQYDDSWSFYPTGEFVYSNSGSTWTPWAGEVGATFEPASFEVIDNGPFFGEPTFSISSMLSSELGLVCGWFGTMDSGSDYEVVSLSETSLTVLGEYVDQGCNFLGGFWTLTFERTESSGFCIQGCFDEMACNYDPDVVVIDNETCVYPGCDDPAASNYDSTAGCPSECLYVEFICADVGEEGWNLLESGTYPEWQAAVQGIAWSGEWVLNIEAVMEEPSTGVPYPLHHFEWTDLSGIPTWAEDVTFELGTVGPNEQRCISVSGVPILPGMHEIQVEGELFISIFGQPFSIGIQSYSAWLEVLDNPNPIPGCTYANAVNFLSYATDDDGSCLFGGCTDEAANNFNPIATIDDGSCGEECEPGVDSSCSTDANNDGTVSVADLLILLGEFGLECE